MDWHASNSFQASASTEQYFLIEKEPDLNASISVKLYWYHIWSEIDVLIYEILKVCQYLKIKSEECNRSESNSNP